MMKKYLNLIIFFFIIFISLRIDVLAFSSNYNYNYEVERLSQDSSGNITIKGWAILNAGVCDTSNCNCGEYYCTPKTNASPRFNDTMKKYGSGTSGTNCDGDENNKYKYTLYVVPIDNNGASYNLENKEKVGNTINGSSKDLTKTMCRKDDYGRCVDDSSPCYNNVGWSFTFNSQEYVGSDKYKNGYIFYLEIYSTGANQTTGFSLSIYENKIDTSFGNNYSYTNGSKLGSSMTLQVIAFDGYHRSCSESLLGWKCQRNSYGKFENGTILNVDKAIYNSNDQQTYYKIAGKSYYIPASWVAPAKGTALVLPSITEPIEVSACSDHTTQQEETNDTINSCSGTATFEGSNYSSCTVDEYSYYTRKCDEKNFKAKLNINGLADGVTEFNLTNGAGITATANLETDYTCEYTFDIEKFKSDYNDVLYNLNYYEANSADWYATQNIKEKLDNILTNYINQTNDLEDWESNYDFTKANVLLKVGSDSKNLVYNEADLIHETIDLNNDSIKESNYCIINKTETIDLAGTNYNINTNVKCGEHFENSYQLPKICLSMKNGEVENCVDGSSTQIAGGNKLYVDMNSTSGNISLELSNLGRDGNWNLKLQNCSYSVSNTLKDQIKFRQIDLNDPFIQKDSIGREIGKNYLNAKYNFVNIIKSDIWEENFSYQYMMSKQNIVNIRKDTDEEGVSSYLGRNCYFSSNNKYVCDFVRNKQENGVNNQTNWFTNVSINE